MEVLLEVAVGCKDESKTAVSWEAIEVEELDVTKFTRLQPEERHEHKHEYKH